MTSFRPGDRVVVGAALSLVVAWAFLAWSPQAAGDWVELTGPAGPVSLPLAEDGVYRMEGRLGPSIVRIQDGQARFEEAPCRNRVCIAAGWLHQRDAFAACIPNGVTMRIRGDGPSYDAIAY